MQSRPMKSINRALLAARGFCLNRLPEAWRLQAETHADRGTLQRAFIRNLGVRLHLKIRVQAFQRAHGMT